MSDVVLYGSPPSSYTRTARLVAEEKGAKMELVNLTLGSPEHLALHPFARLPILKHGDLTLYETSAIARYLDETLPGPSLVPASAKDRAVMEQWISAVNSYIYEDAIKAYLFSYIFPKTADKTPDRARIDAALPNLRRDLGLLDGALANSDWIAGKSLSLADLFVAPITFYATMFPEGKELAAGLKNLSRFLEQMNHRPSFLATMPPRP